MYVWEGRPRFVAVAHAPSVARARELVMKHTELGESGDGSCPERDKAREIIKTQTPAIW